MRLDIVLPVCRGALIWWRFILWCICFADLASIPFSHVAKESVQEGCRPECRLQLTEFTLDVLKVRMNWGLLGWSKHVGYTVLNYRPEKVSVLSHIFRPVMKNCVSHISRYLYKGGTALDNCLLECWVGDLMGRDVQCLVQWLLMRSSTECFTHS